MPTFYLAPSSGRNFNSSSSLIYIRTPAKVKQLKDRTCLMVYAKTKLKQWSYLLTDLVIKCESVATHVCLKRWTSYFSVVVKMCEEISIKRRFVQMYFSIILALINSASPHTSVQWQLHNANSVACSCILSWGKGSVQFRTMLPCSSHITVLRYKTSWWHGFHQGQTRLSISIYQIPCWLQRTMI